MVSASHRRRRPGSDDGPDLWPEGPVAAGGLTSQLVLVRRSVRDLEGGPVQEGGDGGWRHGASEQEALGLVAALGTQE
jgi:hypothetical protein